METTGRNKAAVLYIAEPDGTAAQRIAALLRREDRKVRLFVRGGDLLAQIDRQLPDLVISEWDLPDGSGEEICRRLREHRPQIPLLILTELTDPALRIRAIQLGALDFFFKPFDPNLLAAKVDRILDFSGLARERAQPVQPENAPELAFLAFLRNNNRKEIVPQPDLNSSFGFSYPELKKWNSRLTGEKQFRFLEKLYQEGYLGRQIYDVVKLCPQCGSVNLNVRPVCPQCRFPVVPVPLESSPVPEAGLPDRPEQICQRCHFRFDQPLVAAKCLSCGAEFEEKEAVARVLYSYRLKEPFSAQQAQEPLLSAAAKEMGMVLLPEEAYRPIRLTMERIHREVKQPFGEIFLHFADLASPGPAPPKTRHSVQSALLLLSKIMPPHTLHFLQPPDRITSLLFLVDPAGLENLTRKLESYLKRLHLEDKISVRFSIHGTSSILDRLEANLHFGK